MEEIKGDLFSVLDWDADVLKGVGLCHCVSSDFEMGRGIAVSFKNMFMSQKTVDELRSLPKSVAKVGKGAVCMFDHVARNGEKNVKIQIPIFNLITKTNYYGKPTLLTLKESLFWLREESERLQVSCLSMPRIGSGLDRLNWDDVKLVLNEVFENSEVKIKVFYL